MDLLVDWLAYWDAGGHRVGERAEAAADSNEWGGSRFAVIGVQNLHEIAPSLI